MDRARLYETVHQSAQNNTKFFINEKKHDIISLQDRQEYCEILSNVWNFARARRTLQGSILGICDLGPGYVFPTDLAIW